MRNALALLVLVSAAASAHAADREQRPIERPIERPEPRPCKCARPKPVVSIQLVGKERDAFRTAVLARLLTQRAAIGRCVALSDAQVALRFKRHATRPSIVVTSAPAVTSCLQRLELDGFTAAPRAMTIRFRATTDFRR